YIFSYSYIVFYYFFFFSSRRRHTRFSRDWSSDVCSSDLLPVAVAPTPAARPQSAAPSPRPVAAPSAPSRSSAPAVAVKADGDQRSEERRVGKEGRYLVAAYQV